MTEWNAFTVFVGKDDEPVEGQYCVERGELQTQLRIDSDGLKDSGDHLTQRFRHSGNDRGIGRAHAWDVGQRCSTLGVKDVNFLFVRRSHTPISY